jgi:hypothetical protein
MRSGPPLAMVCVAPFQINFVEQVALRKRGGERWKTKIRLDESRNLVTGLGGITPAYRGGLGWNVKLI